MVTISLPQYLWLLFLITCTQEPLFGLLSLNCRNGFLLALILHELTNLLCALSVLSYISCRCPTEHNSWGLLGSKCSRDICWTDFVALVIVNTAILAAGVHYFSPLAPHILQSPAPHENVCFLLSLYPPPPNTSV